MTDADTTVLVTGYEPFGEFETNPARQLAAELDGETIAGATIVGRELPVAFERMRPRLEALVERHDPDIVCGLGLAAGRTALSLERVGINLRDTAGVPDNDDRAVVDERVAPDGPDAYFATLPVREMKAAMREGGVPTALSTDAGTHLCNDLLYESRRLAETTASASDASEPDGRFRAGFVHVPCSHEQAAARDEGEPSMALETMAAGLRTGLAIAVETAATDPTGQ